MNLDLFKVAGWTFAVVYSIACWALIWLIARVA